ncbi:WD40 repeat domain-containing protein [Streptomyces sp. NPDC056347]|uniref:WD40 repeat domain-containing protein n=1 Tax=Streptomyces sp. NPDC056347 TaxID=3345790 RepID=UPI0035DE004C
MGSGIPGPLLKGRGSVVTSVAFSRDGVGLVVGSEDGFLLSMAFSEDGKRLATISGSGSLRVWNMETPARRRPWPGCLNLAELVNCVQWRRTLTTRSHRPGRGRWVGLAVQTGRHATTSKPGALGPASARALAGGPAGPAGERGGCGGRRDSVARIVSMTLSRSEAHAT